MTGIKKGIWLTSNWMSFKNKFHKNLKII